MTRTSRYWERFAAGTCVAIALSLASIASPAWAGDDDHWTLGAGIAYGPEFLGSDEYEFSPVPLVDVKYGHFFANTGDGIGFTVYESPQFIAGAALNWMNGYDDDDVPTGIEEVDGSLGVSLFVATELYGFEGKLAATQAVTETDRGLLIEAGIGYPIHVTDRLVLSPGIGTSWANGKYMDGYFGINASEAAASGLTFYEPSGGFRDVEASITARYRITDSISAMGLIGVTQLVGDAADSPLVEDETSLKAVLGVSYTF